MKTSKTKSSKHKTYAETQNKKPFNWLNWLKNVRYGISEQKLNQIQNLSGNWPNCAVGNMCAKIPRHNENNETLLQFKGEPKDDVLLNLGMRFNNDIKNLIDCENRNLFNLNRLAAIETFLQVEERSTEILVEMGLIKIKK